jgi:predicted metal-dependent peptidase
MTDVQRRLVAAKLWAVSRFPYFASALFAMKVDLTEGGGHEPGGSWVLPLGPSLVAGLDAEALGALLVHHVCHLVRSHPERGEALLPPSGGAAWWKRWTLACDLEINDDLRDLPAPGRRVVPEDFGLQCGLLAEEYLSAVPVVDATHCNAIPRTGRRGEGDEETGLNPYEARLVRAQVRQAVRDVVRQGASAVPAGIARWAETAGSPVVPWRHVLASELRRAMRTSAGQVDYSYSRPSRRTTSESPVVLPSLVSPRISIAIVCDTSASISPTQLDQALAEIGGLIRAAGIHSHGVWVLAVDSDVRSVQRVTAPRPVSLPGGGGTDMAVGIRAASAIRPRPQVIIVLTDGACVWPRTAPVADRVIVGLFRHPSLRVVLPEWADVVRIAI